jgi:hypothetical protein
MSSRSLAWLVGISIPLLSGSFGWGQSPRADLPPGQPDNYVPGGPSPKTGPNANPPGRQVAPSSDPRRKKLISDLFRKIGQLKPTDAAKRSLDDFFLIGTAELNIETRHADVRFETRQGQQAVAEYVGDYVLAPTDNTLRKWHVFSRHHAEEIAQQALADIRRQFDLSMAYQDQLRQIYQARTMRRC